MPPRLRRAVLAPAMLAALLPLGGGSAQAAPGTLDPAFGKGGVVVTPIGEYDEAHALALQNDGKIVAAGTSLRGTNNFALVRYTQDGSLDHSFGRGGKVTTAIGDEAQAFAVRVQRNGKIVAAGTGSEGATSVFVLARYKRNGSLDSDFGSGGRVIGPAGGADAMVLQPDGKIVLAGAGIVRYNADGSLDTSFGSGGKVTVPDPITAVVLQPDGRIVVAYSSPGDCTTELCYPHWVLARYKPDGSPDASFKTGTSPDGVPEAIALQPDGKLVVAGAHVPEGEGDYESYFVLARYNSDGSLDTSFNYGGIVRGPLFARGESSWAYAVVVQPGGKIVAAGATWNDSRREFALARYTRRGSVDPSFGTGLYGGIETTRIRHRAGAFALALQGDGKLVAAGMSEGKFALVRYLSGKERCIVPKVVGKRAPKARKAIRRAYCSVGRIMSAVSSRVEKGRVIAQKPTAGRRLPFGAKVNLVFSKGKRR